MTTRWERSDLAEALVSCAQWTELEPPSWTGRSMTGGVLDIHMNDTPQTRGHSARIFHRSELWLECARDRKTLVRTF